MSNMEANVSHFLGPEGDTNQVLVVDTAAVIKGMALERLSGELWTTPDVMEEVRDHQARKRLATAMYDLKVREPSDECIARVVAFAKATGDLPALSVADIRVIALTLMFEVERNGTKHVRRRPSDQPIQRYKPRKKAAAAPQAPARDVCRICVQDLDRSHYSRNQWSRYNCGKRACKDCVASGATQQQQTSSKKQASGKAGEDASPAHTTAAPSVSESHVVEEEAEAVAGDEEEQHAEAKVEQGVVGGDDGQEAGAGAANAGVATEGGAAVEAEAEAATEAATAATATTSDVTPLDGNGAKDATPEDEDDCAAEWITPDNFEQKFAPTIKASVEESQRINVACITADFAMQNVLLQMGLRLLGVDGRVITRVKQWARKCFACYEITREMGRTFCAACGNDTLRRVSISVDASGTIMTFEHRHYTPSTRGTKFPLPKPKGGRNARRYISSEDEMPRYGMPTRRRKPGSSDAMESAGEFFHMSHKSVTHHAMAPMVGNPYQKKNPNASKRRIHKRSKKNRPDWER